MAVTRATREATITAVEVDYYEGTQMLTIEDVSGQVLRITLGGAVDAHEVGEPVLIHGD